MELIIRKGFKKQPLDYLLKLYQGKRTGGNEEEPLW